MPDSRISEYARLLVEGCVDVQPRWQVVVESTPLARPLVDEVVRVIAERGAYALLRLRFANVFGTDPVWVREAPEDLVAELPAVERYAYENIEAAVVIAAPENMRDGTDVDPRRYALLAQAMTPFSERVTAHDLKWVGCYYPTAAAAQEAGMSTRQFEDFLYGACLIDWDAERERMTRIADRFDDASEVRIVAPETDLTFSLEGRRGEIDARGANMPGGEVFYSPVEDSAEGEVAFVEYPGSRGGFVVDDARFRFEGGRIVDASASSNEEYLMTMLDTDEGARRLGEFGIGCNPGIQRHIRNTLFDEKIEGTVHLAIGRGFPQLGGTNQSALHWDFVKEMRRGGELFCDGEVVQRDGVWLI